MPASDRLRRDYAVLATIEILRSESDNQRLGRRLENALIEAQLRDIELATELEAVDEQIRVQCG